MEMERHNWKLVRKYNEIEKNEIRYEEYMIDDAEIVVIAYGTTARIAKGAIKRVRKDGVRAGMIRPITLWPFPKKVLIDLAAACQAVRGVRDEHRPDAGGRADRPGGKGGYHVPRQAGRRGAHARGVRADHIPRIPENGEDTDMKLKNAWPKYYKKDVVTHYCPGCGHGIVHRIVAEVLEELDLGKRAICVNPAGCAVLAYLYFDFDVIESAHGRGTAIATGVKRSRPDLFVFTYQGDGDLSAIGTAETIHSANRGENICVIFINNAVYGMTGGQLAPTTLIDMKTTTTPLGRDPKLTGIRST